MIKQIFINLPVTNLEKSKAFFVNLGFTINEQFTNKDAACIVMSETMFVMLLTKSFYKTFTSKKIIDATSNTEVINAIAVESKAKVNEMVEKALASGGFKANKLFDHGWMYSWSFEDPDHHVWEVMWSDISQLDGKNPSS
jgi:uncharacterized protein